MRSAFSLKDIQVSFLASSGCLFDCLYERFSLGFLLREKLSTESDTSDAAPEKGFFPFISWNKILHGRRTLR